MSYELPTAHVVPAPAYRATHGICHTCMYVAVYDKATFEDAQGRFYEANYWFMLYVRETRT